MSAWTDFNDAEQQQSFDLIPKGTIAPVRLTIRPGGHDDASQGWTGGWATQSEETGAVYLACEFVVTEGEFAKRKIWSNIGLHSPKGDKWAGMGRSFIRAILNSARAIDPADVSPEAAALRRIDGFGELDGIEFLARIDVERDGNGELKNVVKLAIEPGHAEYRRPAGAGCATAPAASARPATRPASAGRTAAPAKPAWAQ